jgi:copper oxidase (laccase) domain-containing protein
LLIKISSPNKIAEDSSFIKHSACVKIASNKHLGFALNNESPFKPADALITQEKNTVLGIFIADCLTIFFMILKKI